MPITTGFSTANLGSTIGTESTWGQFSDGTLVFGYTDGTAAPYSTKFVISRDAGSTWTQVVDPSSNVISLNGTKTTLKIIDDVIYVVYWWSSSIGFYLKKYSVNSTKNVWTLIGTSLNVASGGTGYGPYWPTLMEPYKETDGLVRLAIGYTWYDGTSGYANCVILKDNNDTTFTNLKAFTTTGSTLFAVGDDDGMGWCIDGKKNIHIFLCDDNSYDTVYVRIPNTGIDTWGSMTTKETIMTGNAIFSYNTRAMCIKSGYYAGKIFATCNNRYFIKNEDGTTFEFGNTPYVGFGAQGSGLSKGMTQDEYGNIWFLVKTASSSKYFTFYLIDGNNGHFVQQDVINLGNLYESNQTQANIDMFYDSINKKIRWSFQNQNGTETSYSVCHGNRDTVSFSSTISKVMYFGQSLKFRYLSNGDGVVLYKDGAISDITQQYKIVVTKDRGITWSAPITLPNVPSSVGSKPTMFIDSDDYIHILCGLGKTGDTNTTSTDKLYYWRGNFNTDRSVISWNTTAYLLYTSPTSYQTTVGHGYNNSAMDNIWAHKEGTGWYFHTIIYESKGASTTTHTLYLKHVRVYINSNHTLGSTVTTTVKSFTGYASDAVLYPSVFDLTTKNIYATISGSTIFTPDPNMQIGTYSSGSPGTWSWTTNNPVYSDNDFTLLSLTTFTKTTSKRVRLDYTALKYNGNLVGSGYASITALVATNNMQGGSALLEGDSIIHLIFSLKNDTIINSVQYYAWDTLYASFNIATQTWGQIKKLSSAFYSGMYDPVRVWPSGLSLMPYMLSFAGSSTNKYMTTFVNTNNPPVAPTHSNISSNGYTINKRPKFFALVSDQDIGNTIVNTQIQISTINIFTTNTFDVQFGNDSGYGSQISGWTGLPTTSNTSNVVTWTPQQDMPIGTYYMRIRTKDNNLEWSVWSTTQQFTIQDPLWSDTILLGMHRFKAQWINDLATIINESRKFRGLSTYTFTDGTVSAGVTPMKSVHIVERRNALNEILSIVGVIPVWTDNVLSDRKSIHVSELRSYCAQT